VQFSELQKPRDLDLTLDGVTRYTIVHRPLFTGTH